ncbi:hypothetical protein CRG98_023081 [Punica granatum]|uniref:Retrotransposon gag domain-containing protein n=1 Tax=Punica granatum TaxID=22663 RepID=A0A2I0JJV5_PUNGR|nr:hypothetical protein CRG98_023081 [Punica granatum]
MASFEERMIKVENVIPKVQGEAVNAFESVKGLTSEALVTIMRAKLDEFKGELARVKRTHGVGASVVIPGSQLDIPKPNYAEDEARAKFRRLKHKGDLREYGRTFLDLMLQITSMNDKEAFFQFMDGLKPWAKQDLQCRIVQDLNKDISTADSLGFRAKKSNWKGKAQKSTPKDKKESSKSWKKEKEKGQLKCFLCDGLFLARECSKRGKLVSLFRDDKEEKEEGTQLDLLRILSSIRTKLDKPKGLMFVDIKLAPGSSNLFISREGMEKLGLCVEAAKGHLKTVNSAKMLAGDVDPWIEQ